MGRTAIVGWGSLGLGLLACGGTPELPPAGDAAEAQGEVGQLLAELPNDWGDATCINQGLAPGFKELWVAPSGSDTATGETVDEPLASLKGAHDRILALEPQGMTRDYKVTVRGGTYRGQMVTWTQAYSATHRVHIVPAANEKPIFDGTVGTETTSRKAFMFNLLPDPVTAVTNLTLAGMTVQNYVRGGIAWRGQCGRIYDNEIRRTGDSYGHCRTNPGGFGIINGISREGEPCSTATDDCWCLGVGSIDMLDASHNLVKHNDVIDAQNSFNGPNHYAKLHGIYMYLSSDNLVQDNYVHNCSGSGLKTRHAANNNIFRNNYFERVNYGCIGDLPNSNEDPSQGNELVGNVCTFWNDHKLTSFISGQGSFVYDPHQASGDFAQIQNNAGDPNSNVVTEIATASAVADVDGDGKPEVFVALYYPDLGFTKVVYSDGGNPDLRTVAYSSSSWQVTALTAIRPAGFSRTQVAAAYYEPGADQTQVSLGSLSEGVYSFGGGALLLNSSGASGWKVSALTAGRFGSDTSDRLITAAVINGVQQIHRGDGKTPQSGSSLTGVSNGTPLYSNPDWRVTAMTNGAINSGANQLITAFKWIRGGTPKNSIYLGDGVSGATTQLIHNDASLLIKALTVGKFGGPTPQLVTGFDANGGGQVWRASATNVKSTLLYSNSFWDVTSLTAGDTDLDGDDELVSSLDLDSSELEKKTHVYVGDGISGITNGGAIYKFPL